MGQLDLFTRANIYLEKTLGIQLQDKDRGLLKRAGKKRFLQAVRRTFEQHRSPTAQYAYFIGLLWELIPNKRPGTKMRNPHAQKILDDCHALDERLAELIAREP